MTSSKRISALVAYTRPGFPLYDFCCDHGLIGLQALRERQSARVTFVDQSDRALDAIRVAVKELEPELRCRTQIVCSAAEDCLIEGEASDVIIAGVGVHTIIAIIDRLFPQTVLGHRLILSPQQMSQPLRKYLQERGFGLVDEWVLKENGRYREILVIEQGGEAIDFYGRRFIDRDDPDSIAYVAHLKAYYENLRQLKR